MGRMAMRKHDYTTALPLLEKAAKLMPKDEDAWYYLGLAQVNTGSHKEAVESFMASLKIFPRSPRGLYGLGEAAMAAKQYDKAMKAFDDAYAASRDPHYLYKKATPPSSPKSTRWPKPATPPTSRSTKTTRKAT